MRLRSYQSADSAVICSWIKDEKSLYQWSAGTIGRFPLADDDLNAFYAPVIGDRHFIPLSAVDEKGTLIGHLRIRYPDEADKSTVRFGFVIVDPALRGQGFGKEMLRLAIDYAKNVLCATRITLGVFSNNDRAKRCYLAAGFRCVGKAEIYKMPIGDWECEELELTLS